MYFRDNSISIERSGGIISAYGSKKKYYNSQPSSRGWDTGSCFTCGKKAINSFGGLFLTCEAHKAK